MNNPIDFDNPEGFFDAKYNEVHDDTYDKISKALGMRCADFALPAQVCVVSTPHSASSFHMEHRPYMADLFPDPTNFHFAYKVWDGLVYPTGYKDGNRLGKRKREMRTGDYRG